jgi:4'-phosphopantetheinyl transferase EntD
LANRFPASDLPGALRAGLASAQLIERILPAAAVVAETMDDSTPASLFPEEEALVVKAVEKRRREFAGGRACAREALERLGVAPGPILAGERGEPLWPPGVVGSITHCRGYRACAVARDGDLAAIGIDAEPNESLPRNLIATVARPEERGPLAELAETEPEVSWDRLLFSAKEALYKAWYPLTGRWLGFEDGVCEIDPEGSFTARLLVPGAIAGGVEIKSFHGRWAVADGLIATAVAISP